VQDRQERRSSGHHHHVLEHVQRQRMPAAASRSLHFGRMPVARNRPVTLPVRT
jgi:hypothetical protein